MRRAAVSRFLLLSIWLTGFVLAAWLATPTAGAAQEKSGQDEALRAADNLAQTAANAQKEKEFDTALDAWNELLNNYPNSRHHAKALLYSGICNAQLQLYDAAVERLKGAIATLSSEEVESLGAAHLFLGHCQFEVGKTYERDGKQKSAEQLYTTAAQTFEALLERFPKFKDCDQAAFFQGAAYEKLDRLEDAAKSYEKMLQFPEAVFRFSGLFALANVNEQLGRYDIALKYYRQYLETGTEQPDITEVRFRAAETLWQLALGERNKNNQREFDKLVAEALKLLEMAANDERFQFRDEVLFRRALITSQQGDHTSAAGQFAKVAEMKGSGRSGQAMLFTGREFLQAKNYSEAEKWLARAAEQEGEYSVEATHWMAQTLLQSGKPDLAYDVANNGLTTAGDSAAAVDLLMDRAEAAWQQTENSELRSRVPELFLAVVERDSKHALAPLALYNAAYACLDTKQFDQANDLATRFAKDYPQSDYLPDTLEVQADALIGLDRPGDAIPLLDRLNRDFAAHVKRPNWQVRRALADYLGKNYDAAAKSFGQLAPDIADPVLAAEAYHWLGASLLQLKQNEQAISAFEKSRSASQSWRRAAETLSLLSQAHAKSGNTEAAESTLADLRQKFPEHEAASDAELRLAKQAFQEAKFDHALTIYDRLLKQPPSELTPHALYDSAWCLAKLAEGAGDQRLAEAEARFTQVISKFDSHELADLSLLGRAAVRRQAGKPTDAVKDLDQFLAKNSESDRAIDARYERGLALADSKDWAAAIAEWNSLLERPGTEALADRIHYELAWAHREQNELEASYDHFQTVAQEFSSSPVAADAFFQLGERDYNDGQYGEAIGLYQRCLDAKPSGGLREKALYKLGFAHFRNKEFASAVDTFRKQVQEFPQGTLYADGLFMVGEALFENNEFDGALQAYRVAKPVMAASENVKAENRWLSLLHSAQSANRQKDHAGAIESARELADDAAADAGLRYDAWLEIGNAYQGLKQLDSAVEAWTKATMSTDKTGARARCMLGDAMFAQKDFAGAIKQFKFVIFGFGGEQEDPEIDPWQAFAAYEIARCNFVQVSGEEAKNNPQLRQKLIEEATKNFEYLLEKFPNDRLAPQAREELSKLKRLKSDLTP